MTEDNTQVDGGQVDDINGADKTDDAKVDIAKQSDGEFMEDTVKEIKETQKVILGEDGSDDDGTKGETHDDTSVITELAGKDIPDAFSIAADATGMSPTDIVAFADKHTDEQLIEMIPTLKASLEEPDNKGNDKVTKQDDKTDKTDDNKDIDPELVKSITEKISKQLEEKLGTTLEEINKFKAHQEEQSNKQMVDTASKKFDEAAKEFPVFGKTDGLPRFPSGRLKGQLITTSPEMKARNEVLSYADAFIAKGANIDDAMANALATYKGLHLGKELERKQVRDLKNYEKTLSGARTGRETKKKYADTRSEIIDDIKKMKRVAGVD